MNFVRNWCEADHAYFCVPAKLNYLYNFSILLCKVAYCEVWYEGHNEVLHY